MGIARSATARSPEPADRANVDFFSAPMLYYLGIPPELDTCVFAISRSAGWTAHVIEQYNDATLIRPGADYIGPKSQEYTPLDGR